MSETSYTRVRDLCVLYVQDLCPRPLCPRDLYVRDMNVRDLCGRELYVRDLDVRDLCV